MIKSLTTCVLLAIMPLLTSGTSRPRAPDVLRTGLVDDTKPPAPASDNACAGVTLSRGVKYGDSERNVLDVATAVDKAQGPRPVLLFVAGESFADDGGATAAALRDQALCLAAQNGLVSVTMTYRLAPADPWPAGARDVAAAISWIHQNIDLFGGDTQAIVAVGYSVGAFHLASLLAHKELQNTDSNIAGAILISGIYRSDHDANDGERSYFGTDANKYDARSAFPGILQVDAPIVLAWSSADPAPLVAQSEKLKQWLCNAGHCPRTAVLTSRFSAEAVFGLDSAGESLAGRTQQLISQIQTRGLP
ncbi:alpha/beta hydrolase [Bradyrhizobium sp.]|jgi:acetyl esterase/lipase|uniref:alpha/beta hydrolase n=1 Tax=Bradyrhizobium sp. TaxID=376 RepID=UPI002D19AC48|nr:alpha/beta hydrolase [Bradyrhizobium sp.]HWX56896.1 alpha/beta hydrolase [Bradyrhizobium sp.]